jgi:hypothetical protein
MSRPASDFSCVFQLLQRIYPYQHAFVPDVYCTGTRTCWEAVIAKYDRGQSDALGTSITHVVRFDNVPSHGDTCVSCRLPPLVCVCNQIGYLIVRLGDRSGHGFLVIGDCSNFGTTRSLPRYSHEAQHQPSLAPSFVGMAVANEERQLVGIDEVSIRLSMHAAVAARRLVHFSLSRGFCSINVCKRNPECRRKRKFSVC